MYCDWSKRKRRRRNVARGTRHVNTWTRLRKVLMRPALVGTLRWFLRLSNGNYVYNVINSANYSEKPRTKRRKSEMYVFYIKIASPTRREVIKAIHISRCDAIYSRWVTWCFVVLLLAICLMNYVVKQISLLSLHYSEFGSDNNIANLIYISCIALLISQAQLNLWEIYFDYSAMDVGIPVDSPNLVLLFYVVQLFLRELHKSKNLIRIVPMDMSGYYGKFAPYHKRFSWYNVNHLLNFFKENTRKNTNRKYGRALCRNLFINCYNLARF